jgi:hypothetical protein
MPLEKFKDAGLLFNSNFLEQTSEPGTWGYRGELVVVPGEVADAKGHNKPPVEVMRGAVLLADDMKALLYVVNIKEPMQVEMAGIDFTLIPLVQGVPWNEVIDELALEKSDFKGQSAADKIMTLYKELLQYKPKYPKVSLDEALGTTTETVREAWGAV